MQTNHLLSENKEQNFGAAKIEIAGITTNTIIGCYPHERIAPQQIIIDLSISLYLLNWLQPDDLATTIDYDGLTNFIQQEVSSTNYQLLESLSKYLSNKILERYPIVNCVQLRLTKPAICGVIAKNISVSYECKRKFKVALALGSNCDLAQQQIITAIEILGDYVSNIQIGGFYETTPVGGIVQANFINTAITGYTDLKPEELLSKIKTIEKLMGKHEIIKNGPRMIDIDLILFDNLVYQHNFLQIPHKFAHLRDFVLQPLFDIVPHWVHPVENKTISQLLVGLPKTEKSILQKIEHYKNN